MKFYLQAFFCGMLFGAGSSVAKNAYWKRGEIKKCIAKVFE